MIECVVRTGNRHFPSWFNILMIVIISESKVQALEPVPLKLELFLVFPSSSRSLYVSPSFWFVLERQSWWSVRVHSFQVTWPGFMVCFHIFYCVV